MRVPEQAGAEWLLEEKACITYEKKTICGCMILLQEKKKKKRLPEIMPRWNRRLEGSLTDKSMKTFHKSMQQMLIKGVNMSASKHPIGKIMAHELP